MAGWLGGWVAGRLGGWAAGAPPPPPPPDRNPPNCTCMLIWINLFALHIFLKMNWWFIWLLPLACHMFPSFCFACADLRCVCMFPLFLHVMNALNTPQPLVLSPKYYPAKNRSFCLKTT